MHFYLHFLLHSGTQSWIRHTLATQETFIKRPYNESAPLTSVISASGIWNTRVHGENHLFQFVLGEPVGCLGFTSLFCAQWSLLKVSGIKLRLTICNVSSLTYLLSLWSLKYFSRKDDVAKYVFLLHTLPKKSVNMCHLADMYFILKFTFIFEKRLRPLSERWCRAQRAAPKK